MDILLAILLLILFGRLLGSGFKRLGFDPLIGEVLAGMLLGPTLLLCTGELMGKPWGIEPDSIIKAFADFGVLMLMLLAGLVTDFRSFLENKWTSVVVGVGGVLASFFIVFIPLALLRNLFDLNIYGVLFIAVILSNTAIEVSAAVVSNSTNMKMKSVIMGASFVDDILAVFMIGVVSSVVFTGGKASVEHVGMVTIGVALFLILSFMVASKIIYRIMDRVRRERDRLSISATLVIGFFFAILARAVGLHEVIGAFIAGLIIGSWGARVGPMLKRRITFLKITKDIDANLKAVFGPLFFGYIGVLMIIDSSLILPLSIGFITLLLILALLGKIIGCSLTSVSQGFPRGDSMVIGFAMCGRGALELVLLERGYNAGLISQEVLTSLVLVTILTIILTPILYGRSQKRIEERGRELEIEEIVDRPAL